jgi:hypothetical protein
LSDSPSFKELYAVGRAEMLARNPALTIADGSIADIDVAIAAAMGEELVRKIISDTQRVLFDPAAQLDDDGASLEALANDRLRLARQQATAAIVACQLSRPTAAAGAGTVPAGTILATQPDPSGNVVVFTTLSDAGFATSQLGPVAVNAQCTIVGSVGNVKLTSAYKVSKVQSTLFDPTIGVVQIADAAGGTDKETVADYLARIHAWPDAQRRGTTAAIEFGAKTVAGVRYATAVEELDSGTGNPTGVVTVYVGDDSAGSNGILTAAVKAAEAEYKAAGATLNVVGMNIAYISIALTGTWDTNKKTDAKVASVVAAVIAAVNSIKKASDGTFKLFRSRVAQAGLDVGLGLGLLDLQVSLAVSPAAPAAADLTLSSVGQIPRTSAAYVTMT